MNVVVDREPVDTDGDDDDADGCTDVERPVAAMAAAPEGNCRRRSQIAAAVPANGRRYSHR